jgi:hypothetical protein
LVAKSVISLNQWADAIRPYKITDMATWYSYEPEAYTDFPNYQELSAIA